VTVYTDGACSGNPGPGGWGAVLLYGKHRKELSGGYRLTTNNRMEILAVIRAIEALKEPCRVTVISDSQYVVNAMTQGWARGWRAKGWRRSNKERAENPDLWERLLSLCDSHDVTFEWVRGHCSTAENERADQLAVAAYREGALAADEYYERNIASSPV
jgi:ribonuclease HI